MRVKAEEILDLRLLGYLTILRPVPRRDPIAAARAKAQFLAELEVVFEPYQVAQPGFIEALHTLIQEPWAPLNRFPRSAFSLSSIFAIILVLLFSWVGVTARAAESALPGDSLYSFKTSMEHVQVSLAHDLDTQATLYIEFAARRLQEIEHLVDNGRYQKATALATKFQLNIQKALEITSVLASVDPTRAAIRQQEIDAQLASFSCQLNELIVKIPPTYQPALINIIPPSLPVSATPTATPSSGSQDEGDIQHNDNSSDDHPDDVVETTPGSETGKSSEDEHNIDETKETGADSDKQGESDSDREGDTEDEHNAEDAHPGESKDHSDSESHKLENSGDRDDHPTNESQPCPAPSSDDQDCD